METSNPVGEAQSLAKTKVIALRFNPNDCFDKAALEALNDIVVDHYDEPRRLPNKAGYILSMILGIRPMSGPFLIHFQNVLNTQEERFPKGRSKEWPVKISRVELESVKPGLRLVK